MKKILKEREIMIDNFELKQLVEPLQNWFKGNARVLPWRENP